MKYIKPLQNSKIVKLKIVLLQTIMILILFQSGTIKNLVAEEIWVRLYRDGIGKYKAGLLDDALADLQRALYYKEDLPYAHKYSAIILMRQGNFSRAILSFEKSLHYKKNQPNVLIYIGNIHTAQFSLNKAKRYYLKALQWDPNNISALYAMVQWHTLTRDYKGGAIYIEKIHKIAGAQPQIFINQANDAMKRNKFATSYKKIQNTIEINPVYLPAYQTLVRLYRLHGRNDLAIKTYLEVITFQPTNAEALRGLANLYYEQKNFHLAKHYFIKIIELDPKKEEIWMRLIDLLTNMRAFKEREIWKIRAKAHGFFF